ncbi:MAG: hydroxymethylbilane synthase [Myxococcales bacterium]|nr:hydroxymethylbilane synthase [Myxococcales bacterium]
MNLRIATRGSKLALWQAHHVSRLLRAAEPGLTIELVVLITVGDKILDRPLSEVGGKGLFVKEIEEALLDGRADVAVHSMKDLPAEIPPRLTLAAVPEREDPRDALLVRPGLAAAMVAELPARARVGTSSLRRMCQLRAGRGDLEVLPLRGNVDTRIHKLDDGQIDAVVLALAGLRRLGLEERVTQVLPVHESLPAIGQGALAIETRADDAATRARVARFHHRPTAIAVAAERAFLARLDGSCRTPMAAHATLEGDHLQIAGLVGRPDGSEILRDAVEGPAAAAEHLGVILAERLLARGAETILKDCSPTR